MKSVPFSKSLLVLSVAALMSACGGSDSDNSAPTPPPTGTPPPVTPPPADDTTSIWEVGPDPSQAVADRTTFELDGVVGFNAPVAGATVCIDTTRDFTCDADSPTAITAEDGSYRLTVEAPYATAEFMVLASFPYAQLTQGLHASANTSTTTSIFTTGDNVWLSARGYYGGAVNPLTTLEAQQYDASLSYLAQVERYAIARQRVTFLYDLPTNIGWSQLYQWSVGAGLEASDWGERHDRVLGAYAAAQDYTTTAFDALRLISATTDTAHLETMAQWIGVADSESHPVTNSQRQSAEHNLLTAGQQVSVAVYSDDIEVSNEPADQWSILSYQSNRLRFSEGLLSERRFESTSCWNPERSAWQVSTGGLEDYTTAEWQGDNSYVMASRVSGAEVKVHLHALEPQSAMYPLAMHGWEELLDFAGAMVDGAVVRARYEYPDELCYVPMGSNSIRTPAFSQMTADDYVALVNPFLAQSGLYDVDEELQRIVLRASGQTLDYRVIQRGDRELLMLFVVHGSASGSYPGLWAWENGQAAHAYFIPHERRNAGFETSTYLTLDDQAATELRTQMRALAN